PAYDARRVCATISFEQLAVGPTADVEIGDVVARGVAGFHGRMTFIEGPGDEVDLEPEAACLGSVGISPEEPDRVIQRGTLGMLVEVTIDRCKLVAMPEIVVVQQADPVVLGLKRATIRRD